MRFPTISSPHSDRPASVSRVMRWTILALLPGAAALTWHFGWGIPLHMLLASVTAVACEALALRLRGRAAGPVLRDLSALVTALLFALAIPPLLPWWQTVLGVAFAILVVKQLYGGLGYNPFNPAMAGYALLLISYPAQMTAWLPPFALSAHPPGLAESAQAIFAGTLPDGLSWDALTMATPLDTLRTAALLGQNIDVIRQQPQWGTLGGRGWEWVNAGFLLGGLILLYRRIIDWRIPAALLGALFVMASLFQLLEPARYPSGLFHLYSGATMLGAFFIATDPVTACTTVKGRLIYGAGIGVLVYVIRTWGGYPDAIAFAVLLLNMAASTIDHYSRPRVYGTDGNGDEPKNLS